MHKIVISIITNMLLLQSCQEPVLKINEKEDVKMNLENEYFTKYKEYTTEEFDVDAYEELVKRQKGRSTLTLEDGTIIQMSRPYFKDMSEGVERTSQGFIRISPLKPYFIEIVKIFSSTGKLTRQGYFLADNHIGLAQEFNERGKLIKEIDYEKRDWSKYHYNDVLKFLDKEKVIDLKTGRGRGTFSFYLDRENEKWNIEVTEAPENGYVATLYTLDANTLKVLEVKKEQRGME